MFADLMKLGLKMREDFAAGRYASLVHDVSEFGHKIGDLMTSLFGFQSTPDTCDGVGFVLESRAFIEENRKGTVVAAVGGFDSAKWLAAFEILISTFSAFWELYHRPVAA